MRVPLLDLAAQHAPLRQELLVAMARVLERSAFILGEEVAELEAQVAAYCQAAYGIGVSSGTDALLVALMALDIGPGDEVITTPFTFFATAGSISRLGARPVFVDIEPQTYTLDAAHLEAAITPRTRAIIPVHLYGQCADMAPILAVAARHGLAVIEDAAQAIGAAYSDGRRAGSMGTLGCLSFFPSKNLGGLGDGGMVVTQDAALAERVRLLRVHGSQPKYYHQTIGGNFRLDTLQAATLLVKLHHLDRWTAARRACAQTYEKLFAASGLVEQVGLRLPTARYRACGVVYDHVYHQFVIAVPQREALRAFLHQRGIETAVYYPLPLHLQPCYRDLGYGPGAFPVAERASQEVLALPMGPTLSAEQQAYVVDTIREFYRR
ncbi:MAG: glutamine--scyllo-inositol aminotransferase [Candidatus Tectimicrobiota bacterium]|nr:MAG: glutamine--scyllo-inositol aminotransferase [Candidatus Tectomicrobia bacterium]